MNEIEAEKDECFDCGEDISEGFSTCEHEDCIINHVVLEIQNIVDVEQNIAMNTQLDVIAVTLKFV